MRIGIVGGGSLGLLFSARLSTVFKVEVITRTEEQALAIAACGIHIEGEHAGATYPITAYSFEAMNASCIDERPELDYLLLMVKQSDISHGLLAMIQRRVTPKTKVMCFQNGIGHEDQLLNVLQPDQIVLAVTTEGAKRLTATSVAHTGFGLTYLDETQKKCAFILEKAGFEVYLSNNMNTRIWGKLIINSVINPLTALLKVTNGDLLKSPYIHALMMALYQEGISVAAAMHIELPDDHWTTLLSVCERTASNHSSMLQDLMNGRGTEIDMINGSLLSIADRFQLNLPVNQTVYQLVKALENK
ncbi:putative 2-dehydropantoate 2-reductase [compost metagenome]